MASLRITTYGLLIGRDKSLSISEISKDTNLPIDWLRSFAQKGLTMKSNVDNIQTLYEYFIGKPLI